MDDGGRVVSLSAEERLVKNINNHVSFGFSIFFNGLLLACVLTRTYGHLKPYQKVLLFYIFVDSGFALTNWLFHPFYAVIKFENTVYSAMVIGGTWKNLPQPGTSMAFALVFFFRNYYSCVVAVHFVYRYCIICHNHQLRWWSFGTLCLIAAFGPLVYSAGIFYMQMTGESCKPPLRQLFLNTDWVEPDGTLPAFAVIDTRNKMQLHIFMPVIAVISYSVILVCAILMSKKVRSLRQLQFGFAASRAHTQLLRVLTVQAILPLLVTVMPVVTLQSLRSWGLPVPVFVTHFFFLTPWSPVVNPLCSILFIAPYRRFVCQPFSRTSFSSVHSGTSRHLFRINRAGMVRFVQHAS